MVSSAVHAAVQACAQPAGADDAADGDIVDGADGNGEEALGVWMFQEDDKLRPVKCAVHVHDAI